jgi:hypothetical protein
LSAIAPSAPSAANPVRYRNDVVAVESKLLEYLDPKNAEFARAYEGLAPPKSDPYWWKVYKQANKGAGRAFGSSAVGEALFRIERVSATPSRVPQTGAALYLLGTA